MDEEDEADSGGGGEDDVTDISCIGVRKQCMMSNTCNDILVEYRNDCRENKKSNECVATDRYVIVCHWVCNSVSLGM